jgi:diaminohydroxyphosphoribosylaminopyrimidine deaminase/5-amino-6-(5-phosphoribosylamino)uracil reductase
MLEDAGIEVETGVLEGAACSDHAGFFLKAGQGRPLLTLKLASSFDGRIATGSGESQWITGPEARRKVHGLRACHDAVLVGGGTARADDPSLTVRDLGISHQPVRIVVSRRLDLPLLGKLAQSAGEVPVWLCHGPDADEERRTAWEGLGARLISCRVTAGQVDPVHMMQQLGSAGLTRVFCEGGGALAASLLAHDRVDRLVGFTAGMAIGAEGMPAIGAMGVAALVEAPRFELRETAPVGADICHVWHRHAKGG